MLTVSDGVTEGTREDVSGDLAERLLAEAGFAVVAREVVADDQGLIAAALVAFADAGIPLVITTGGTGFGPRDVTPEATRAVIQREAPGLATLMLQAGLEHTPNAALSRAVVGSRGSTLIVNLPGSPKAVAEGLGAVLDVAPHAIELLAGATGAHPTGHERPDASLPSAPASAASSPSSSRAVGTVTALAVRVEGDPPCGVGSRMVIGPGGPLEGTLGCAEFDAAAIADARSLLGEGAAAEATTRTYVHERGSVEVFLEPHWAPRRLLVFSATPVATELLRFARALGYHTTLVESRATYVTSTHRRVADVLVEGLDGLSDPPDVTTDAVYTDHDAPGLDASLAALLGTPASFIGVMGSRRHVAPHREALEALGCTPADLARVRSPVGMDIGSATPSEIAVAIAAGLVAARTGRDGGWLDRT